MSRSFEYEQPGTGQAYQYTLIPVAKNSIYVCIKKPDSTSPAASETITGFTPRHAVGRAHRWAIRKIRTWGKSELNRAALSQAIDELDPNDFL